MNEEVTIAIETAQTAGSVALGIGESILGSISLSKDKQDRKGVELMPAIEMLFKQHSLKPDALKRVFVSTGPGSFTGLRVGITTAKMFGHFGEALLYPVSTLKATAWHAYHYLKAKSISQHALPLLVALAVKHGTVYADLFELDSAGQLVTHQEKGQLVTLAALLHDAPRPLQIAVEWPERLAELVTEKELESVMIRDKRAAELHAESVYALACHQLRSSELKPIAPLVLVPEYVRPPEAVTLWDARLASQQEAEAEQERAG